MGLRVPGGGCPTVCVGGFIEGRGYGFTSLLFGMNCDSAMGMQMGLTDGRIVRGNADEHQDLFWGAAPAIISGPCWRSNPACKKLGPVWGFGFKWPLKDDIRRPPLLKPSTLLRNV